MLVIGPLEEKERSDSLTAADLEIWRNRLPVTFLGYREDLPRLYAAMDVFVLPSYREGLPRVLTEACLAGIPAIATDIRGSREIVEDRVTGYCVRRETRSAVDGAGGSLRGPRMPPGIAPRTPSERAAQQFNEAAVTGRMISSTANSRRSAPAPPKLGRSRSRTRHRDSRFSTALRTAGHTTGEKHARLLELHQPQLVSANRQAVRRSHG